MNDKEKLKEIYGKYERGFKHDNDTDQDLGVVCMAMFELLELLIEREKDEIN